MNVRGFLLFNLGKAVRVLPSLPIPTEPNVTRGNSSHSFLWPSRRDVLVTISCVP
jgi:hypothetical protein